MTVHLRPLEINPYQSPHEVGYFPPRPRSRWWDFLAYVAIALLIYAVMFAGITTYVHLGLDWGKYFAPWRGWFIALAQLGAIAYWVFLISFLVVARWRRRKQVPQ